MHFDQPIPHLPAPFRMLHIPGGSFLMGSPPGPPDAHDSERPDHDVTLPDFWLGELPVTQDLWQAVMRSNPSNFKGPRRPVETVSWDDAQVFIQTLNILTGGQKKYRLPTEAEWEYAARGGANSPSAFGGARAGGGVYVGSDLLPQVGWYSENSDKQTHEAGLLLPNELGLYDMSGNVWEWCQDVWHKNYIGAPEDGSAWGEGAEGASRVLRGGSWYDYPQYCRAANRRNGGPTFRNNRFGFRVALAASFQ